MNKKHRAAAAALCMSILLCGCSARESEPEKNAVETGGIQSSAGEAAGAYADDVFSLNYDASATLNPFTGTGSANLALAPLMYEGLFAVNAQFGYDNVLCQSISSSDGVSVRLDITSGVKMHDGSELTAEDAAASINQARVSARYSARLSIIAAAYTIDGSLYVELTRPNYSLPLLLDIPIVRAGTEKSDVPVGTGAYCYFDGGDYCCLKAFDGYRDRESAPLERIYLRSYEGDELISAFESGLIDLVSSSRADINYLEFGGNTEMRYADTTNLFFLGVSRSCAFLGDKNRRILFSSCIDRAGLAQSAINGTETTLPLNPSSYLWRDDYDQFTIRKTDIEKAMEIYAVQDYDGDGSLEFINSAGVAEKITLSLVVCRENPVKLDIAHRLRDSFGEIGITLNVKELSWSEYISTLQAGNYDLYLAETEMTADFDLTELMVYGGSANYGVYDPALQTLIYDFNAADSEHRQDAAGALYSYTAENLPIIPLMFEKKTVYTHRETVTGLEPTVHSLFGTVTDWTVSLEG